MKTLNTLKRMGIVAFMAAFTIVLCDQLSAQTVKGNKTVTIEEYNVGSFDAIEVGSAFNVVLRKGDTPSVKIETDENLQKQITLKVKEKTLSIGSKGMNNPTKLNVFVTFTELRSLDLNGAANLKSESPIESARFDLDISGAAKANLDINATLLNTDVSGAANITLRGRTETHKAEVSGAANLDALMLITKNTNIEVSGAAKAKITATENINSDVSGAGSLYYFENEGLQKMKQQGKAIISIKGGITEEKLRLLEVTENGDSTRVKIGNIEIEVYEGDTTTITIGSKKLQIDESGNIKLKKDKQPKFNGHWAGFLMGINGLLTEKGEIDMPAGYEFLNIRYERSINYQLNLFEQNLPLASNKLGLVTGLGFEWNKYRFDKDNVKLLRNTPTLQAQFPDDKNYTKSKFVVTHLNIPLMIEFQTNAKNKINSFHIGVGVLGGLRIGSYNKLVYENGKTQSEKQRDDFHINPFKADALLRLGWGKINLYGTYALTPMFRNNKDHPELYPFSVGLSLLAF
ncbi:MAG: DUF2807 domain-containing protein [Bacteroidales bacterium]|nr:DUF2807 domain-containing protein [Bacteroidales bacterium]MDZ4203750.1 DUF2807 domain-containing protein [Bacteroidales bacterium]